MLKRIEIKGFKSFAEKTVVDFDKGITCIVGPNGSGKSNITDAFRWVLGEQSYKSLRGSKMQDVIFNGTVNRSQHGYCEVSLLFDNYDKFIKTDFDEVLISRKLFRSGLSEYRINGSLCRLKDIRDLFTDTGIGVEGYSIIGQGRIDQLLSSSKEDRRLIFEEASGIVKYKNKKEEAERKLEKTASNLERIDDIINELESRIEPLKEASKNARAYMELKSSLKSVEISLYVEEIEKIKAELDSCTAELSTLEERSEIVVEELFKFKESEKNTAAELDDYNIRREELKQSKTANEKQILQYKYAHSALNDKIENSKNNQDKLREKLGAIKRELEQLYIDAKEAEEIINERVSERDEVRLAKSKLTEEHDEKNARLKELENKYFLRLADKRNRQRELENLALEIAKLKVRIEHNKSLLEDTNKEIIDITASHDINLQNLKSALANLDEIEKKQAELSDEKKSIESDIQVHIRLQEEIENAIFKYTTELNEINHRAELIDKNLSNYETSSDAVQFIMKKVDRKRVYGTVAALLSVEEKYEKAIESYLASRLENVVVSDYDYAAECIALLREERVGRVTFMPLDTLKPNPILDISGVKGLLGHALDFVNYDETVSPAIEYLLFNVVIAENLEQAKLAQYELPLSAKIVTLSGDVVNVGGTVSGGSPKKHRISAISLRREYEELIATHSAIEQELTGKRKEREKGLEEARLSADRLKFNQVELDKIRLDLNDAKLSLSHAEARMADVARYENDKKSKIASLTDEEHKLAAELIRLETEERLSKDGFEENKELEDGLKLELEELRREISDIAAKISDENLILVEKEYALKSAENLLSTLEEKKNSLTGDEANIIKSLGSDDDNLLLYSEKISELEKKLEDLERELLSINESLEETDRKLESLKEKSRGDLEKYKKIEEESATLKDSMYAIKINAAKLETRYDNEISGLWQDYEMGLEGAKEFRVEIDLKEARKQVRLYKSQIAALGDVNLSSVKEYEEVSERYDFMSRQKLDLKDSMKKLHGIIDEMDYMMRSSFTECLADINEKFSLAFKDLFRGGTASIELQEGVDVLDSEIIINAMPPGKRLQSLELLSGGEKALTAIAIMFAILKTKPAPFCILDEIEAALDDRNISLFSNYLKKYSSESQFIVITHRKGTMEIADSIYGVTMREKGVSDTLSLRLSDEDGTLLSVG